MKLYQTMAGTLLVMMLAATGVCAQGPQYAFVDMDKLFHTFYATFVQDEKLEKQKALYEDRIKEDTKDMRGLNERFENLREQALNVGLSDAARRKIEEEAFGVSVKLEGMKVKLKQFLDDKKSEMLRKREKARDEIVGDITKQLAKVAKEEGYAMIFDVSGNTSNKLPAVVYYAPELDITAKILAILNEGHEQEVEDHMNPPARENENLPPEKQNIVPPAGKTDPPPEKKLDVAPE